MNQTKIERIVAGLMEHWAPPPPLKLDQWADENIVLPETQNARPGHYRTWPYLREPLDSIGANGLIIPGRLTGRNTLTRKSFRTGASLKILSARAPRRLRRHDFRVLYCDEIDAMEITVEGDPIVIAEKRTFTHADRKIVRGSTPTEEDVSLIQRAFVESDQRIFEICCPHCREFFELLWEMIQWPEGEPEKASCFCPRCGEEIEEKLKPELVELGRWRPMRPEIVNHRGYRLNALISLLPNAAWGKLAAEWLKAKRGGPAEQQVFVNLILGKPWKTSLNRLSAEALAGRVEPIRLERSRQRSCSSPPGGRSGRPHRGLRARLAARRGARGPRPRRHRRQHARGRDLVSVRRIPPFAPASPVRVADDGRRLRRRLWRP
jgi:phage terminase large subunit GpA-like protein